MCLKTRQPRAQELAVQPAELTGVNPTTVVVWPLEERLGRGAKPSERSRSGLSQRRRRAERAAWRRAWPLRTENLSGISGSQPKGGSGAPAKVTRPGFP